MKHVGLLACASLLALAAGSKSVVQNDVCDCRHHKDLVGPCFTVHGRLAIRADGPPSCSIWVVGTKHHLGVSESHGCKMPSKLESLLTLDNAIFADFTVCPYTAERPREMQMVCISEVRNVVVGRP